MARVRKQAAVKVETPAGSQIDLRTAPEPKIINSPSDGHFALGYAPLGATVLLTIGPDDPGWEIEGWKEPERRIKGAIVRVQPPAHLSKDAVEASLAELRALAKAVKVIASAREATPVERPKRDENAPARTHRQVVVEVIEKLTAVERETHALVRTLADSIMNEEGL